MVHKTFGVAFRGVVAAFYALSDATRLVLAPVAGPLDRAFERWERAQLERHRAEDLGLADLLDRNGLADSAAKLRDLHR